MDESEYDPLLSNVSESPSYKNGFALMGIKEKTFWVIAIIIGFSLGVITLLSVAGVNFS